MLPAKPFPNPPPPPLPGQDTRGRRSPLYSWMRESVDITPFCEKTHENLSRLWKSVKDGEASEEELVRFSKLFGPDENCLGWKFHRYSIPPIYDMYYLHETTDDEDFKPHRLTSLKGYAHFALYGFLYLDLVQWFRDYAAILYHPDDNRLESYDAVAVAAFRTEVIWPVFGSTQAFWETFIDVYKEVESKMYEWPSGLFDLSYGAVKAEFQAANDTNGVKLMEALILTQGEGNYLGGGTACDISGSETLRY